MVEHVTYMYVEVIVAVVIVRAPVVTGIASPKFDVVALSGGGRDEYGSTKPPNVLPVLPPWPTSVTMVPDTDGSGLDSVTSIGYGVECECARRSALVSDAAMGGVAGN